MTTDTEQDKTHSATVLDLFGLHPLRKPRRRHDLVEPLRRPATDVDAEAEDTAPPHHWSERPLPLSAEELPYCKRATGPTYRSAADRGVMLGHERSI